ncbi:kinase-like domain-containing protein [Cunninghamella echinulata]|nr:kinase-like domain-containing protein [Cunninghamella echinulata]
MTKDQDLVLVDNTNQIPNLLEDSKSYSNNDIVKPSIYSYNTHLDKEAFTENEHKNNLSMDSFDIKGTIGYGSSAIVYSAIYIPQQLKVALKMIDLDMFERNQIDELRRETALMALSKHENILPVYSSFVSGSKLAIVTPFLAGGSCLDIMKTAFPDGLDELSIATILKQALDGLAYLHKNGHIHRDVKAGNLLMDDDGTVLLGDFGVSSSLMDTGGRGVRKTFVGTPCWMAPEVMEQAGYDYKADIWSFGITAIELATGQAPFAKLPPLKVLLMTLSHDPPTLNRENTKHKYSKTFKDMIDLTLNKDPTCRPSAEKLLLHPFFRQAKKKDYLVKTILHGLPDLEIRPRKTIQKKQLSFTTIDEWDFNDDDEKDDGVDEKDNGVDDIKRIDTKKEIKKSQDEKNNSNGITCLHIENTNNHLQQQDEENITTATNNTKEHISFPPKHKRHISFGNVVVRNPPYPTELSPTNDHNSNSKIHPPQHNHHRATASLPTLDVKKTDLLNLSPSLSGIKSNNSISLEDDGVMNNKLNKDISESTLSIQSNEDMYLNHPLTKTYSNDSTGEKKSRFEIQHGQSSSSTSTSGTNTPTHSNNHHHRSIISVMSSNSTREGINHFNGINNTHSQQQQHRSTSKSSTSLSNSLYSQQQHTNNNDKELTESKRKVGRFELTTATPELGHEWPDTASSSARNSFDHASSSLHQSTTFSLGSSHNNSHHRQQYHQYLSLHPHQQVSDSHYSTLSVASSSPPASVSGGGVLSPSKFTTMYSNSDMFTNSIIKSYMEDLVTNMEAQKNIIHDICSSLHMTIKDQPHNRHRSHTLQNISASSTKSASSNEDHPNHLLLIESLEKQLDQLGKENMMLRKENETLRKELESIHFHSKEMI